MLKAASACTLIVGAFVAGGGIVQYMSSTALAPSSASAIQITQIASQSTFTVVCGLWFVLFGFAVGAIAKLRDIHKALMAQPTPGGENVS